MQTFDRKTVRPIILGYRPTSYCLQTAYSPLSTCWARPTGWAGKYYGSKMVKLGETSLDKAYYCEDRSTGSSVIRNFSYSSHSLTSSSLSSSTSLDIGISTFNGTNGEFYYDEDFSIPFDANLTDACHQVSSHLTDACHQVSSHLTDACHQMFPPGGALTEISWPRKTPNLSRFLTVLDLTASDQNVGCQASDVFDSIQGNENDFKSQSSSSSSSSSSFIASSTAARDGMEIEKREPRDVVVKYSKEELPKVETQFQKPQETVTTWARVRTSKSKLSPEDKNESSSSNEIDTSTRLNRRKYRFAGEGYCGTENLVTWGTIINDSLNTSLEGKSLVKDVPEKKDISYNNSVIDFEDSISPVGRESGPIALATEIHDQSDDTSITFPVAMTTWQMIKASSRSGCQDDSSSNVCDSLCFEGQRSLSRRRISTPSPSSKDDGYDSVTLKDLSEISEGHVFYEPLAESGRSEDEVGGTLRYSGTSQVFSPSEVEPENANRNSMLTDFSPKFGSSSGLSCESLTGETVSIGLQRYLLSGQREHDTCTLESEVPKPTVSDGVLTRDLQQNFHDSLHESDNASSVKIFFDSMSNTVSSSSSSSPPNSANKSTQTTDDRSVVFERKDGNWKDPEGRPLKIYSINTPLPDLSFLRSQPLTKNSKDEIRGLKYTRDSSNVSETQRCLENRRIDLNNHRTVDVLRSSVLREGHLEGQRGQSFEKNGRECSKGTQKPHSFGFKGKLDDENSSILDSKPQTNTKDGVFRSAVEHLNPKCEEKSDAWNTMERLVIEVCKSCNKRTVNVVYEGQSSLGPAHGKTTAESLPVNFLESNKRKTEQKKFDANTELAPDPMRTAESPASNRIRRNPENFNSESTVEERKRMENSLDAILSAFSTGNHSTISGRNSTDEGHGWLVGTTQNKTDLLLNAISAIELLLFHFNRNRKEKEQLGSTRSDSEIGQLILRYLCPALRSILMDGLKSELRSYLGKVKNSVRQMIEESVTLVGMPIFFQDIVSSLNRLKFLNTSLLFFNAFVFSLLNCRVLDVWLSCVTMNSFLLKKHYTAQSLLRQNSEIPLRSLHDFLAFLQPLSLLPFRLEYDFEVNTMEKRNLPGGSNKRSGYSGKTFSTYESMSGPCAFIGSTFD